jgi:hypothetical protein
MQDQAVTESMGAITDHAFEHLGPSDRMITLTRRRLLNAARAWRDRHVLPAAVAQPSAFHGARAGSFVCDAGQSLEDAYREQLAGAVRWGPA